MCLLEILLLKLVGHGLSTVTAVEVFTTEASLDLQRAVWLIWHPAGSVNDGSDFI